MRNGFTADDVIGHMESFLGPMEGGWSVNAAGDRLPFKVLRFARAPVAGSVTFTTLGVSDSALTLTDGRLVRQARRIRR